MEYALCACILNTIETKMLPRVLGRGFRCATDALNQRVSAAALCPAHSRSRTVRCFWAQAGKGFGALVGKDKSM